MKHRIYLLDNLRGLAFILMLIQHIFYFFDKYLKPNSNTIAETIIEGSGTISRHLFILLAGYSLYMTYKKNKNLHSFFKNRIFRSIQIIIPALIITFLSYLLYPTQFIRFGILHFIALSTLLLSIITPYKLITILCLGLCLLFAFPSINPYIDLITGASYSHNMMDWFPLNKYLPVMILGLIIAQHIDLDKINIFNNKNILTLIGQNSLSLYTTHVILFLIITKIIDGKIVY